MFEKIKTTFRNISMANSLSEICDHHKTTINDMKALLAKYEKLLTLCNM